MNFWPDIGCAGKHGSPVRFVDHEQSPAFARERERVRRTYVVPAAPPLKTLFFTNFKIQEERIIVP
jgi:hypothetical protein